MSVNVKERIKEIRALPSEELNAEITKAREKVFKLRFHGKGKDLENPGELKALRKDIARLFTALSERRASLQGANSGRDGGGSKA